MRQLLNQKIYQDMKHHILHRTLKENDKLPSKRKLASSYNVSVFTIEKAYGQLMDEGYIYALEKKGYFVNPLPVYQYKTKEKNLNVFLKTVHQDDIIDLSTNAIDLTYFPFNTWRKLIRKALLEKNQLFLPQAEQGILELRFEIKKYLEIYRGIDASVEQIVVGSGSQAIIQLLIALLGRDLVYGMENPGFLKLKNIFELSGIDVKPISMDEIGISVSEVLALEVNCIHITPSHQYPTGKILPIHRRLELLNWAYEKPNRYLIEDDYDSEFRYQGQPTPALQTLDHHEKVIYMNTFSKSLSPATKINYLVLPKSLLSKYQKIASSISCSVPPFDQYILSMFMQEGHFERHLNRMKRIYRQKIELILRELRDHRRLHLSGYQSGLHMVINIEGVKNAKQVQLDMLKKKVMMPMIQDFYINKQIDIPEFVFGYAHLSEKEIIKVVQALKEVLQ